MLCICAVCVGGVWMWAGMYMMEIWCVCGCV